MIRSLRDSAGTSAKCLPAGRCSLDYRRRDGRLEPLRWFLITEIPAVIILLISTIIVMLYYNGQSDVIADETPIATHFSWATGCGDRFGLYASTSAYHTSVTYAPLMTLALCLTIGVFVRQITPNARCCRRCCRKQAGERKEEMKKVARGWFVCLCLLSGGLNFLLAPVLSFGWSSNYLCLKNSSCAHRMAALATSGDPGVVCCDDYVFNVPGSSCNVAAYRIIFICTSFALALAICVAFYSALYEKSRRQAGGALMPGRAAVYGEKLYADSEEYDVEDDGSTSDSDSR